MFGLYVGNSSACIAMLKDGEVQVLVNDVGSRVTSASVEILDNERVVGVPAKAGPNNSENVIYQSKRYLCPERAEMMINYRYAMPDNASGVVKYTIDLGTKIVDVTPKEVSTEIFKYLYKIASSAAQGSDDISAILTVPYYFTETARYDYFEAAVSGGFKILQVITEPAAAIMAYDCLAVDDKSRKILIYRVGGISVEVSVALVKSGMLEILKSSCDTGTGGDALTAVIFDYLALNVEMKMHFKPLENPRCRLKLYKLAENCKHILSTNSSTTCCLETFYNGMDYSHIVTRSRVESLISTLIVQLARPVDKILEDLSLTPNDIDKVIMCGGTSKVPKLQKKLQELFPNSEILISIPPDEVIAVGAAKQGKYTIECSSAPHLMAQMEIPKLAMDIYYKVKDDKEFDHVMTKDTILPITMHKKMTINPDMEKTVVEFHSQEGGTYSLLKEVIIPKIDETKKIELEISVDGEGALECKLCNIRL